MTTDAEEWQRWTEARTASVSAPHGMLALVGTHWLDKEPVEIPGVPGRWSATPDGVGVTAAAGDGLRSTAAAGGVVEGELLLRPDTHPEADTAHYDDVLLVPIERDGELALRVFDPAAEARTHFAGISVYPYAPEWSVAARFIPFESGEQSVVVANADGRERPLDVTGRIAFQLAGEPYTLTVSRSGDRLSGVLADAGSGQDTYRFRFVTLPAPDEAGRTVLDLNRAYLPPCAFADHFICPFPPPGNRLPVAVRAGEKAVLRG
ncbi:DUF1684 domain-containing protein [Kitasatospora sp. LaBMicrA B282]|uniref:DUF1684 domain-containing protein n=1 Tax=Kitasatospora sp. LaBMicrA B282 TaxID=3420949 RepID=UPI003D0BCB8F